MSEVRLIDANALKYKNLAEVNGKLTYVLTAEEIDNAQTVDPYDICKGVITGNYALGFHLGWEKAKERPQGDLADEVWKLYEKHQPHLATYVIEFGDELKELLGKYQRGGKEE